MVYRGPYKIRVEERHSHVEHPNDAIVQVTLAAICGSDLHLYHGMMPDTRVGMTFGHEFIVVHEVGPSVQSLKPGTGHGAVQYLLRLVLLLRSRPVLQLSQRQPQRNRGRRHLRVLPHLRWLRRRTSRVRAGALRRRRSQLDSGVDGR